MHCSVVLKRYQKPVISYVLSLSAVIVWMTSVTASPGQSISVCFNYVIPLLTFLFILVNLFIHVYLYFNNLYIWKNIPEWKKKWIYKRCHSEMNLDTLNGNDCTEFIKCWKYKQSIRFINFSIPEISKQPEYYRLKSTTMLQFVISLP